MPRRRQRVKNPGFGGPREGPPGNWEFYCVFEDGVEIGPLALDVKAGLLSWVIGNSGPLEVHDHMVPFGRGDRVEVEGLGSGAVVGNGFALDRVIVLVDGDKPLHLRQVDVAEVRAETEVDSGE